MGAPYVGRRAAVAAIAAAGAAATLGRVRALGASGSTEGEGSGGDSCAETPGDTAGPFASRVGLVRSDIREGRPGTPLVLTVRVLDVDRGCAAVHGATVGIWHADAAGAYSEYGSAAGETFLRGLQRADARGEVRFQTIYPGWYSGRATHVHLEVTVGGVSRKVTDVAFPDEVNAAVHATGPYARRGPSPLTNARDGILADSLAGQLVRPVGDPNRGYAATFEVRLRL